MEPTPTAYGELQLAFRHFNEHLFDGALPPCLITLQREKRTMGYYSPHRFGARSGETTDEIALNPEYFGRTSLIEVLQTVVHEMVHHWQFKFGKPGRGKYHNHEWAEKMESLGLMPSSTGKPGGKRVGDHMADYPIKGGRFLEAVNALVVKQGFSITWYDRYTGLQAMPSETPAELMEELPDEVKVVPVAALMAQGGQSTAELDDGATLQAPAAMTAFIPTRQTNRSNRVKYACAGCKAQVWGKSGLEIGCMRCSLAMQMHVAETGAAEEDGERSELLEAIGRG